MGEQRGGRSEGRQVFRALVEGRTPVRQLILGPDHVTDGAIAEWCASDRVMVINRTIYETDPDEAERIALLILGHAVLGDPSCWHTSGGFCVRAEDSRDRVTLARTTASAFLEASAA